MKEKRFRLLSYGLITALTLPIITNAFDIRKDNTVLAASSTNQFSQVNLLPSIKLNSYEEKLKEAEEKKKELEQKKKDTQANIDRLEKEKSDILAYIEELDMQLNELTASLDQLAKDIEETKGELEVTKNELQEAKETEAAQYETMKRRIQYLYENGSEGILDVFLSSGDIVEFLNQVEYSKRISEYDGNLLSEYIATKELIEQQEQYLSAQLEELKLSEEAQMFEQQTLEELSAQKGAEIIRYTEAINADEELFSEYAQQIVAENANIEDIKEEERKRVEEEARRAEEARKAEEARLAALKAQEEANALAGIVTSGETSINNMMWPLPGDGNVYSKFGYRIAPTKGASTYHRGVDIGGAQGASIVASLAGTVEDVGYNVTAGNYVNINHGNGVVTRYLHCSKILVSVGDHVDQGEVISLVGSTGVSTGPHLHFSLIINGNYVDPLLYISYK